MTKILIVDDDAGARRLVEFSLQQDGLEVVTASNGLEALERAQIEQPDVIVMDVIMPVMAGLEACLRLKEIPTTSHIPILILSSKGHEADRDFSLMAGADDFLAKPATPAEVAERVHKLLIQGSRAES
jgi:two-component system alkaline phosphatase synthesis response regulator PhoP